VYIGSNPIFPAIKLNFNLKFKIMELDVLIEILEASVKKNGEKPLTNKWLLNILKQTERQIEKEEADADHYHDPHWD
jgi:hypothetical protein